MIITSFIFVWNQEWSYMTVGYDFNGSLNPCFSSRKNLLIFHEFYLLSHLTHLESSSFKNTPAHKFPPWFFYGFFLYLSIIIPCFYVDIINSYFSVTDFILDWFHIICCNLIMNRIYIVTSGYCQLNLTKYILRLQCTLLVIPNSHRSQTHIDPNQSYAVIITFFLNTFHSLFL